MTGLGNFKKQIIMKHYIFFTLFLFTCSILSSQETINHETKTPTEYGKFIIPLWSKVILELKEKKKGKYEYRVISIEPHEEIYSLDKDENLFSDNPQKNTIEIFFVGAFYNEGKEDSDYKTLLMLRNNLNTPLNYSADIKYYYNEKFENTSIVGTFPNANTHEIWTHKIDYIKLYDFQILD